MAKISTAIDIGSSEIRVLITSAQKGGEQTIIGIGRAPSRGIRHGYVLDAEKAAESIEIAIKQAEAESNVRIKRATVIFGGALTFSQIAAGDAIVSKADNEITDRDIENALGEAEKAIDLANHHLLDIVPISYKVDGKLSYGKPTGMRGIKVEVKAACVLAPKKHVDAIFSACSDAGVEVTNVLPSAMALASIALLPQQRIAGAIIIDIGAETTTYTVYENDALVALSTLPMGGRDITNDIALGLKVSLEEAEGIKIGSIISDASKRKVDDIIGARLEEIFEGVDSGLRKIKRSGLLPAGALLAGGTSMLPRIAEIAKNSLGLPVRFAEQTFEKSGAEKKLKSIAWFPVYSASIGENGAHGYEYSPGNGISFKKMKSSFLSFVKQFLP